MAEAIKKEKIDGEECVINELVGFFDLLARLDFEDKKRSTLNTESLVSAPKGSVFSVDQKD